jgi:hypothetical protein
MGYVDKHLLTDERVLRRGQVSFTAYIAPAILFLVGLATAVFLFGFVLIVYAIVLCLRLATTEVAVTNRRIIGKVGLISTNSLDLRLAKLEGVSIRKGLLGALFNYGSITVAGSGSTRTMFPGMHNPEDLRRAFVSAAEKSDHSMPQSSTSQILIGKMSPVFEVQVIDGTSGYETWIEIKAKDKEEALRRATDTGMIVGLCRLKSVD